ncbi:uncharacterized protein LOC133927577 [Phragmites australis]|uniref:uncharacterized protein LOC133927577 n=1 Tax=Phragmites australis TaxID=29695 RepID=UPI002D76A131|nr:uncharacterized protein LOC133927577 [Phragmites australis]
MLHLQKHLSISFRQQWLFSVTRFATAGSTTASPDPSSFAVEDYLVASCHLTRGKALKASKALTNLKSPSKLDAVLTFLSGVGLSPADITTVVVRHPRLLCCKVDNTLTPRLAELRDLDLSPTQICRLVLLNPAGFRHSAIVSKLKYYALLFGSFDKVLYALKRSSFFLNCDIERVVKPNVSLLREWGLGELGISKICRNVPRLLSAKLERVQAMVVRAEGIGVPRGTPMHFMWRSSYVLTRKLRRTSLKTMLLLAEGKCSIDSDCRNRELDWKVCNCVLHCQA